MFLKISQNPQENTCGRVSFLIKCRPEACNFVKKETPVQMFSCEFFKISRNTFFTEHLLWLLLNSKSCFLKISIFSWFRTSRLRSCLYEENYPTQVRRLTWVRSQQNGVFRFVKTNHLYENWFISPKRRSHVNGDEISLRWDDFSPCKQFLPGCPT